MMIKKLILAALMPLMASCAYVGAGRASKNIVAKNVAVADFHALKVSGAMSVTYTCDSTVGVAVSAPDNVMPWIMVESHDGTLEVYMKKGHPNFRGSMKVKITASSPVLSYADVSGASSFNTENLAAGEVCLVLSGASKADIAAMSAADMTAEVSGASEVNIDGISGGKLSVDISGASYAKLSGRCDVAELSASGASKIDASDLAAQNISKSASGASKVTAQ